MNRERSPTRRRRLRATLLAPALVVAAEALGADPGGGDGADTPPFHEPIELVPVALGPWTWPISTGSEEAQRYFDQGMQLRWAYNVEEAARSMAEARRRDPECAMCWWGEAFALGAFLNGAMSREKAVYAHRAITRASSLAHAASPVEQALVRAAVVRYPADYEPERKREVDQAFADAMAKVYERYPDHHEVATVYAVSLFLLEERRGYRDLNDPDLQRLHAVLRSVLDDDLHHPGACHLYIHATESSQRPELGLPCAETLGATVPVASHIRHMPSHTWNEVGLWDRSVRANTAAWHADREARAGRGFSYAARHNLHMLLFAASFDGQGAVAVQAGRDYREITGDPLFEMLTLLRFGRFREILEHDGAPEDPVSTAVVDFARGYAALRQGEREEAARLRDRVLGFARDTDARFRFHPAGTLVGSLGQILAGEILRADGDVEGALSAFEHAVALEDQLGYDEPEPLPFAPRHWLGAALLEASRPLEAEVVYRTELADHPHNGWSLFGLLQALEARGVRDPAVERDFAASWARADVELTASRF